MNKADLPFFCCLACKADLSLKIFEMDSLVDQSVRNGVLFCQPCKIFYPIDERVPFLLDSGYYEYFDMQAFLKKWDNQFDFRSYKLLNRKTVQEKVHQLNFYNEDSVSYDDLVSHSNFWRASDWNVMNSWIGDMPMDGVVLDMGCGTGRCSIPLAKSGRRVIATDLSIGMLRQAISKNVESGEGNITYFLADAEDLPLKKGLFSTVISFGMMHHVANPEAIVAGAERLLMSGGCFYALENNASPLRFIFDILMRIKKLWNEEAGSHPLFKIKEVKDFITHNNMYPEIRTSTFLPPHLFNRMGYDLARNVLSVTDRLFGHIPLISIFGGQLVIKGTKK
jgi:ubiquinone/menaquinone biosynthesis C-methylase UbiE/uncharacterized protein YbaR (Trm112 family)